MFLFLRSIHLTEQTSSTEVFASWAWHQMDSVTWTSSGCLLVRSVRTVCCQDKAAEMHSVATFTWTFWPMPCNTSSTIHQSVQSSLRIILECWWLHPLEFVWFASLWQKCSKLMSVSILVTPPPHYSSRKALSFFFKHFTPLDHTHNAILLWDDH